MSTFLERDDKGNKFFKTTTSFETEFSVVEYTFITSEIDLSERPMSLVNLVKNISESAFWM